MKNRMPKRKTIGKVSSYLRSLKSPYRRPSPNPRGSDVNSTKIGAGYVRARRDLPMDTVHRRNHRSKEMIGVNLEKL